MMVRKKEQFQLKEMFTEAIAVLCKASLTYRTEFSIEGLIGITLDDEEIILVNINEHIQKELQQNQSSSASASPTNTSELMSRHRQILDVSPPPFDKKRLCVQVPSTATSSPIKEEDVSDAHLYGNRMNMTAMPLVKRAPVVTLSPSGQPSTTRQLIVPKLCQSRLPLHSSTSAMMLHHGVTRESKQVPSLSSSTAVNNNGSSSLSSLSLSRPPDSIDGPMHHIHRLVAPSGISAAPAQSSTLSSPSTKSTQSQELSPTSTGGHTREAMSPSVIIKQDSALEACRGKSSPKRSDVNRNWPQLQPVEVSREPGRDILSSVRSTATSVICSRVGINTVAAPTTSAKTNEENFRCIPPPNMYPDESDASDSDSDHLVIATDSAEETETNSDASPQKTVGELSLKETPISPKMEETPAGETLPLPTSFMFGTQSVPEFPSFTALPQPHKSEEHLMNLTPASKGLIFACTQCDEKFDRRYNLTQHLAQIHGAKTHDCKKCGKHFLSKQCLYQHMRIVHTDKQHKCEYCNMAISTRQKLQLHQRRRHPEHPVTG